MCAKKLFAWPRRRREKSHSSVGNRCYGEEVVNNNNNNIIIYNRTRESVEIKITSTKMTMNMRNKHICTHPHRV